MCQQLGMHTHTSDDAQTLPQPRRITDSNSMRQKIEARSVSHTKTEDGLKDQAYKGDAVWGLKLCLHMGEHPNTY